MQDLILYRQRLIPNERILLKDDVILYADDSVIVTKWKSLHAKATFDHGYSCYYLKEGYKISRFLRPDGSLHMWYCDIVEYNWSENRRELTCLDLLADVIIQPDGKVQIVDLNELTEAREQGLLTEKQLLTCLKSLDKLISTIYFADFEQLIAPIMTRVEE